MPTILTEEEEPTGTASQEASRRQVELIYHFLETRYVSEKCASRIINILNDQPIYNTSGLEDLKRIQREP